MTYYDMCSLATCVAFLQLSSTIYNPLIRIVGSYSYIKSVKKIVEKIASFGHRKRELRHITAIRPEISLQNVTIRFADHIVLSDVTYRFEYGKRYLLTGESVSGKTSLLNSIFGYDTDYDGTIFLIDDTKTNIAEIDTDDLIGYVQQRPYLFIGSLVQNITAFCTEPDMSRVEELIKVCKLEDLAKRRGLDTILDTTDNPVSYGEMQRISLARILYQDRPVMFFDEVTASLDQQNALDIYQVIYGIEDKLVICISHDDEIIDQNRFDKRLKITDTKLVEY